MISPDIEPLVALLRQRRMVVLAGAGCSTESGIPDYRGPDSAQRKRAPVQYQEFMRSAAARVRYWSRSAVGWPRMAAAQPNATHYALAQLEAAGAACGIITQNVDGLHHAAGSVNIVELHGSLADVCCTSCNTRIPRAAFQHELMQRNPQWARAAGRAAATSAPDGDAEIEAELLSHFDIPACHACGGVLKPAVVFFGENVPRDRVDAAWQLFGEADVLLVVGSSLTVYSGRRFVYRAVEHARPIGIVNMGPTRADDVAAVKVEARLGAVLPKLAAALV